MLDPARAGKPNRCPEKATIIKGEQGSWLGSRTRLSPIQSFLLRSFFVSYRDVPFVVVWKRTAGIEGHGQSLLQQFAQAEKGAIVSANRRISLITSERTIERNEHHAIFAYFLLASNVRFLTSDCHDLCGQSTMHSDESRPATMLLTRIGAVLAVAHHHVSSSDWA
jgi:hypothetical protein